MFIVDPGTTGAALVARARAFVAAHPRARFHGTTTVVGGAPRSPVAPAQTQLAEVTGEFAAPRRTHVVLSDAATTTELVMASGAVFVRSGETRAAAERAAFVRADPQPSRLMHVRAEQAKALDIGAALSAATAPRKLRPRGAATIVEADIVPRLLFGPKTSEHVAWVTLQAVIADDGEVTGVRLVVRGEATIVYRIEFASWTAPRVAIAAPAQVDTTPAIATAELATFKTPLLMPRTVPAGWKLVRAGVLPPGDTEEGCTQVELAYEDQRRGDAGYLYLYEFARTCPSTPDGATAPFTAGKYNGFSASDNGTYVQITVAQTTLQALSDLPPAQLARTLSELVPLALRSA